MSELSWSCASVPEPEDDVPLAEVQVQMDRRTVGQWLLPLLTHKASYWEGHSVLEGSLIAMMIISMHFYGLPNILRCVLLFELREDLLGRQNELGIKNMNELHASLAA